MTDPDVLISGEMFVDFIPESRAPLSDVERFSRRAGGAPANVAIALGRLDAPAYFLTRVAEDIFGTFLTETLAREGVSDRFVTRDPDRRTSLAFVSHDPTADRRFSFYRDDTADVYLDDAVVPDETLESMSWVYVGGVMLAAEPGRSATLSLASRARAHECSVIFDPNTRPELWSDDTTLSADLDRMLDRVDVLKASPEDVTGTRFERDDPVETARVLADAGPHTVFLTLGGDGALAHASTDAPWEVRTVRHDGYDVEPVDTTGAGDAFTAGALASLAGGETDLATVLDEASAVAALTTTGAGAITSLPDRKALAAFRAGKD